MKSHLKMALESISAFSNDGKMDEFELKNIFEMALKDGVVDADEKRILTDIIGRLTPEEREAGNMAELLLEIEKLL